MSLHLTRKVEAAIARHHTKAALTTLIRDGAPSPRDNAQSKMAIVQMNTTAQSGWCSNINEMCAYRTLGHKT